MATRHSAIDKLSVTEIRKRLEEGARSGDPLGLGSDPEIDVHLANAARLGFLDSPSAATYTEWERRVRACAAGTLPEDDPGSEAWLDAELLRLEVAPRILDELKAPDWLAATREQHPTRLSPDWQRQITDHLEHVLQVETAV